jgi:hypothetical protein
MQPAEAVPTNPDELRKFLKRASEGDASTLPALRKFLGNLAAVDAFGGDLAKVAQRGLVAKFAGEDLLLKEAVTRKMELLRAELAGPNPSALERLLVERVVACWLHLHHLEAIYSQQESVRLDHATYYQRSLSAAQKRYLGAIKALAVVRRLALPVLVAQVNVAHKQQVNVAGGEGATRGV